MKPQIASREVEVFGLEESTGFAIRATPKAFEILSSGLYRNKIRAVLREISANARDAHKDAGIEDRPFAVHLPTTLSPHLSIRDFGKGMTHPQMLKVYQTYFASLKEDSNDFIGGLGLGSKSPFSYTDAYTVISRCDGEARTYDLFKDDTGEPKIAVRSVEPLADGEETGLEVIVPLVQNTDQNEFAKEAAHVYELYPVRPRLTGKRIEEKRDSTVIYEGRGWKIYQTDHYSARGAGPRALMDVIAYQIDGNALITGDDVATDKSLATVRQLLSTSIDVEFAIGDLDITAGREDIAYQKVTKAKLRARFIEIAAELDTLVQAEFKSCKSLRDAKKRYAELFGYHSAMQQVLGQNYRVLFRGVPITSSVIQINVDDYPKSRMIHYTTSRRGSRRFTTEITPSSKVAFRSRETESKFSIDCQQRKETLFFYDDMEGSGHHNSRIFHYRETHDDEVVLIQTSSKAELKAFRRGLDGYEIRNVSELPKPTYDRSATKAKHKALSASARSGNRRINAPREDDGSWDVIEIDPEEGGIFVVTSRGQIMRDNQEQQDYEFSQLYQVARTLNLIDVDETVIAVPLSMIKQLTETKKYSGKWVNFFDLVAERGPKLFTPDEHQKIITRSSVNAFTTPTAFQQIIAEADKRLADSHAIRVVARDYMAALTTIRREDTRIANMESLAGTLKIKPAGTRTDYNTMWEKAFSSYPMATLALTDNHYYRDSDKVVKMVLDYIELVDHNQKNEQEA